MSIDPSFLLPFLLVIHFLVLFSFKQGVHDFTSVLRHFMNVLFAFLCFIIHNVITLCLKKVHPFYFVMMRSNVDRF